ncbi:hypothetical protein SK128_011880 [Halocaridina rubra]|uniref:Uncharacterized protein n=1 Tax=Halocaridina rubra TaxID=373956 RepID=A0AAN8WRF8_HALRR
MLIQEGIQFYGIGVGLWIEESVNCHPSCICIGLPQAYCMWHPYCICIGWGRVNCLCHPSCRVIRWAVVYSLFSPIFHMGEGILPSPISLDEVRLFQPSYS